MHVTGTDCPVPILEVRHQRLSLETLRLSVPASSIHQASLQMIRRRVYLVLNTEHQGVQNPGFGLSEEIALACCAVVVCAVMYCAAGILSDRFEPCSHPLLLQRV